MTVLAQSTATAVLCARRSICFWYVLSPVDRGALGGDERQRLSTSETTRVRKQYNTYCSTLKSLPHQRVSPLHFAPWLKISRQLARGKKKRKASSSSGAKSTIPRQKPAKRQSSGGGNGASGARHPPSSAGAAGEAGATIDWASAPATASTPPRRAFKRPRMMRPAIGSPSVSSSLRHGDGGEVLVPRESVGGSGGVDGVSIHCSFDRGSSAESGGGGGGGAPSPWVPAASDDRMEQSEVEALVRKLRSVALAERRRRAKGAGPGSHRALHGGGSASGAGWDGYGQSGWRVSAEVEAAMDELRRVAVHGDATTLDILLSSKVGWFGLGRVGSAMRRQGRGQEGTDAGCCCLGTFCCCWCVRPVRCARGMCFVVIPLRQSFVPLSPPPPFPSVSVPMRDVC